MIQMLLTSSIGRMFLTSAVGRMLMPVLLAAESTVSSETIMDILKAITNQFSITQIVAMIAGLLGVSMGFVFLWWGIRKGAKIVFKAAKTGKFSI